MKRRVSLATIGPALLGLVVLSASGASAQTVGPDAGVLPDAASNDPAPSLAAEPLAPPSSDAGTPHAAPTAGTSNAGPTTGATASAPPPNPAQVPSFPTGHFEFGSYGRVNLASDGRGRTGRPADIVANGSRVDEDSSAELEFRREDAWNESIKTRIVTTLALLPPFFHFSGKPQNAIAVRQLYAQATYDDWILWAGSRMYRGDDIYLLNWWPLDNQNTVGGGAGVKLKTDTQISLHAGMQRLDNPFQNQVVPNVNPTGFGSVPVALLDRPRTIETLKITQFFRNSKDKHYFQSDGAGLKAILYGEAHQIASGIRRDPDLTADRTLPADTGFLIGAQLTYWTGQRDGYVSLIARHARGLAAYDPLAVPYSFANDKTTSGTTESQIALAGNYEAGMFGIMAASYVRFFRDGGPSGLSREKYDEGIILARPQVYFGDHFGLGVEGSYQARRYAFLDPNTNSAASASLLRGAILPYFSPSGRGSFKRPQIGLVYAITSRNAGAQALYAEEDVFRRRSTEHFVGIFTEWWFNSSSYP
jgi:hypothetical protein